MQFDRAEPLTPAAPPVCVLCGKLLAGTYYSIQGRSACAACGERMKAATADSFDRDRFLKALLLGVGVVAVIGALNGFIASHWDISVGLPSLLSSILVGYAVRRGSGNRGGRPYQVLAVLLSYLAIAIMFIPAIRLREGSLTLSRALEPLWVLLIAPFLNGTQGLLLWSMFGFALSLSWRLNRTLAVDLRGPFALGPVRPPDGAGGV
jgi:hypothetical protein